MVSVRDHYDNHLAQYYAWICGGIENNVAENQSFFNTHNIQPINTGRALDLGAGCGFQSIPLAESGFQVYAVDLSGRLLKQLKETAPDLAIETICDDVLNFSNYVRGGIDLAVCMGDTLTHLASLYRVEALLKKVYAALVDNGHLIISFRDLSRELTGLDRFFPVRSDDSTIFTCFLEYEKTTVTVHDIVYEKKRGQWDLRKSAYQKCRISSEWTRNLLQNIGFNIEFSEDHKGMHFVIAKK